MNKARKRGYHAIVDWAPYLMETVPGFAQGQAGFLMIEILLVGTLALIIFGGLGDAIGRHGSFVSLRPLVFWALSCSISSC